jgi:outer membrane protein OmpA-like peptidoglycan-associated protein
MKRISLCFAIFLSLSLFVLLGSPVASAQNSQNNPAPTYSVSMVPRTIVVINYQNRAKTEIGFQGSPLMPQAKGQAEVESKNGRIAIAAEFRDLQPAATFGAEYLTYVLWAVTPEGRANNLGEVLLSGTKSKLSVTTALQTFGLLVTAEPYYAVAEPSDAVVLQNVVTPNTTGTLQQVNVSYMLFKRGAYSYNVAAATETYPRGRAPLELSEARNAVQIARNSGAEQYAPDALQRAEESLRTAEGAAVKNDTKVTVQNARDAVQNAADAVQTSMRRKEEEQQAQERAAAARQTEAAQAQAQEAAAKAQQEALARQQADLQRQQAELEAQKASQAKAQAELDAQREQQARAAAESKAQQEALEATQARDAAEQARNAAAQAQQQEQQLRATLLQQFNRILPTTDTPRGLKANLSDVLFATGKYDLQPPAREALAKFAGIVLAHPGLRMQVEGYTDNVGGDTFNQTLSENRANSVRAYLIAQGLDPTSITAVGYGKSNPVADNSTPAGRQQNRRVEIIISGDIIGTPLGTNGGNTPPQ